MSGHVPGQWPEGLRTSPTRELIRRDQQRAAALVWENAALDGAAAALAADATPDDVRDTAARIAARVVQLAETVIQQQADFLAQ
ncbi:hypothetical protein [Kitasatospora aureofaciens]|uniref:hypothetical protein n=1 Tax=Kitasatospora aureofaciens TaxID=1894 RepID=UPI00380E38B2